MFNALTTDKQIIPNKNIDFILLNCIIYLILL